VSDSRFYGRAQARIRFQTNTAATLKACAGQSVAWYHQFILADRSWHQFMFFDADERGNLDTTILA